MQQRPCDRACHLSRGTAGQIEDTGTTHICSHPCLFSAADSTFLNFVFPFTRKRNGEICDSKGFNCKYLPYMLITVFSYLQVDAVIIEKGVIWGE